MTAFLGQAVSTVKGTVVVSTTDTPLVVADNDIIGITFINKGNRDVWIDLGAPAIAGEGGLIPKGFGEKEILFESAGLNLDINGIVSAGTSTVSYLISKRV